MTDEPNPVFVQRRRAKKVLWTWFVKNSGLWMNAYKMRPEKGLPAPWLLTRGAKDRLGYDASYHETLGDLLGSLLEHEMTALIEATDIPAMELIAMAADEGEAT